MKPINEMNYEELMQVVERGLSNNKEQYFAAQNALNLLVTKQVNNIKLNCKNEFNEIVGGLGQWTPEEIERVAELEKEIFKRE